MRRAFLVALFAFWAHARGLLCDNVTIMRVELRGETPVSNRLFITGVRPGNTLCRIGTFRGRPTFFVRVFVAP